MKNGSFCCLLNSYLKCLMLWSKGRRLKSRRGCIVVVTSRFARRWFVFLVLLMFFLKILNLSLIKFVSVDI